MKLNEIKITESLTVKELAAKHGLTVKAAGKAIADFAYNDEIANDFKANGFELRFNSKKNHFDVISDDAKTASEKDAQLRAARVAAGFNASGTARTTANVGGGHSVNGIKK